MASDRIIGCPRFPLEGPFLLAVFPDLSHPPYPLQPITSLASREESSCLRRLDGSTHHLCRAYDMKPF